MKKMMILLCFVFCMMFVLVGCDDDEKTEDEQSSIIVDPYAKIDKSNIYGIDEPILETISNSLALENGKYRYTVNGFDMEITADLLGMLGVKSMRFRIPQSFMTTAGQYDEGAYQYLKNAIQLLKENGVELLIGLIDYFPSDTSFIQDSNRSVPHLDDPAYDEWMDSLTALCKSTCELFPEITIWEMGNEMNSGNFFHPNGYSKPSGSISGAGATGAFEYEEQVQVYTDYMYYAAKGIHQANQNNQAFTSGFAFTTPGSYASIEYFIRDFYDLIKEGAAPSNVDASERSTNPRDYFDGFCWHPYVPSGKGISRDWLDGNNRIYKAIIDNGDEGLPVAFTEFGFHDDGDPELEEIQTEYMQTAYNYMINDMPYVISCCAFRMYQCQFATSWGGAYQNYWGYFTENTSETLGIEPRQKAIALQQLYGGEGDLYKYADCYK